MLHLPVLESPHGILSLCSLVFVISSSLHFFSCVSMCGALEMGAEGSHQCCCPDIAKGWGNNFPFGFLLGSRVWAEAQGALV